MCEAGECMVAVEGSAEGFINKVWLKGPDPVGGEVGSFQKKMHCSSRGFNNETCYTGLLVGKSKKITASWHTYA